MKNKILNIVLAALLLVGGYACQEVENLTPPVSRSGINSFTASFVGDESSENLFQAEIDTVNHVITVVFPYNYPRKSDNVLTMDNLKRVRVEANLDDNVTLSPSILYMDFTQENWVTLTDQSKKEIQYKIIGEIRKSNATEITGFELKGKSITSVIDEKTKTISLIASKEIGNVLAVVDLAHGATMSPDPRTEALNYDSNVEITVTAQDGVTTAVYIVQKKELKKVDLGIRPGSAKILWVKKLQADLGIETLHLTGGIAVTSDYVVVNTRNEPSIYLSRKTGEKLGVMPNMSSIIGNLTNFYTTSDDAGNILVCNLAPNGGNTFKVWKMKDVEATPELYIDWSESGSVAIGRKLSVKGSLEADAIITAAMLGEEHKFARWIVKGGVLQSQVPEIISITGIGGPWRINCDVVYTEPSNPESDYFAAFYAPPRKIAWIDGKTNTAKKFGVEVSSNWILNAVDYVVFNKTPYVVHNSVNSFTWGKDDEIYLYDLTTPAGLESTIWRAGTGLYGGNGNGGVNTNGAGDVSLKVSDNGYYMYLYFMFTNGCVVAVQFDCIDEM